MPSVKRIILPARPHRLKDPAVIATAGMLFFALIALTGHNHHTLRAKSISLDTFIEIDGVADEPVWELTDAVTVRTFGGANFDDGQTDVTVQCVQNGVEAFFHIKWDDPTQSIKHLPLQKMEKGWKVVESGFYRYNETQFYEDKLAVMLSSSCAFGADETAHLGPKPLDDKPANWHGRGYHYAHDGKIRDLWHWKAVRTNDMILADDNFFGAPGPIRDGSRRYTAGYQPDGKESGAYVMNWQWYSPHKITPKRLPKNPGDLIVYQNGLADSWVIPWYHYDLYDEAKDTYPAGTIMPSVLYASNRFEGDRADVRARAVWNDGQWSLELGRRLDTGSTLDVVLKNGVCLWISAFDHAQILHTRHTRPIRLNFGIDR